MKTLFLIFLSMSATSAFANDPLRPDEEELDVPILEPVGEESDPYGGEANDPYPDPFGECLAELGGVYDTLEAADAVFDRSHEHGNPLVLGVDPARIVVENDVETDVLPLYDDVFQGSYGSLGGVVYDSSGHPLDQASVTVLSLDPDAPFEATDVAQDGAYALGEVPIGILLKLTVSKLGFMERHRIDVLNADVAQTFDFGSSTPDSLFSMHPVRADWMPSLNAGSQYFNESLESEPLKSAYDEVKGIDGWWSDTMSALVDRSAKIVDASEDYLADDTDTDKLEETYAYALELEQILTDVVPALEALEQTPGVAALLASAQMQRGVVDEFLHSSQMLYVGPGQATDPEPPGVQAAPYCLNRCSCGFCLAWGDDDKIEIAVEKVERVMR